MKEDKPEYRGRGIPKDVIEAARPTVIKLSRLGCSDKEIGSIVGFSDKTIQRRFREELDEGRGNLRASLRKSQIELAIQEKNPTMLIWLGKCYLGQREPKHSVEHSGGLTVEKVIFGVEKEVTKKSKKGK